MGMIEDMENELNKLRQEFDALLDHLGLESEWSVRDKDGNWVSEHYEIKKKEDSHQ